MLRLVGVLGAVLVAGCGTSGQPLGVTVGRGEVDLDMVRSSYEAATLTLDLYDEGNPRAIDDEVTYHLRVGLIEPGRVEGEILEIAGQAVWESGECSAPDAAFIADDASSPSVVSALGWVSGGLLCAAPRTPLSQRVDGTLEIFEVDEAYLSGAVDITVDPLLAGDATGTSGLPARFHGRFDTR